MAPYSKRRAGSRKALSTLAVMREVVVGLGRQGLVDGARLHGLGLDTGGAAQTIEGTTAKADQEPRAYAPTGAVVVAGPLPGLQEHVVDQVLGLALVAEDPYSRGEHDRGVAVVEDAEGVAVAPGHGGGELWIAG